MKEMTVGERIQQLRKAAGLSQEQLAEQLDVSRQSVSKWELNDAAPEISKIIEGDPAPDTVFTVDYDGENLTVSESKGE